MRWYQMPVEDLPESDYLARANRFHEVAEQLSDPVVAERFEAMAADAYQIAVQKRSSISALKSPTHREDDRVGETTGSAEAWRMLPG